MLRIKYLIVWGLERLCTLLDRLPGPRDLGCYPLRLAQRSVQLDERWNTGYWKEPEELTPTPPVLQ